MQVKGSGVDLQSGHTPNLHMPAIENTQYLAKCGLHFIINNIKSVPTLLSWHLLSWVVKCYFVVLPFR